MDYLALAFGSLLLALDFSLNKVYQRLYGTGPKAAFGFNALLGLFMALIFWVGNGFVFRCTPFSLMMAGLMSTLVMLYNILGFRLLRSGTMAMYTLFLMTGGMTLPYVFGLLFLDEPFRWARLAGLLVMLGGVFLSGERGARLNRRQLLLCLAVFVLNGCVSITSKLHQINTHYAMVSTVEFIQLQGLFKAGLAGALFLFFWLRERSHRPPSAASVACWKAPGLAAASAGLSGLFSLLQLTVAVTLPASVLYPFNTGLTILLSALAGVLLFHEKLSARLIWSMALCFVGTLLFL